MTVCKVQECKITINFNTFVFAIVLFLFVLKETVQRWVFKSYLKRIFQQSPLRQLLDGARSGKKKKKSAATENYLHVQFKLYTSSSSIPSMLAPEVDSVRKLNLALLNIVFGVAFTMNQQYNQKAKCFSGAKYHVKQRSHLKDHSTIYLQKKKN